MIEPLVKLDQFCKSFDCKSFPKLTGFKNGFEYNFNLAKERKKARPRAALAARTGFFMNIVLSSTSL